MVFFTPSYETNSYYGWQGYMDQVKRVFEGCVRPYEDAGSTINCSGVAACVNAQLDPNHQRPPRGIVVLAVSYYQIGESIPNGGLYVESHEHYLENGDGDDRLKLYIMPPYR